MCINFPFAYDTFIPGTPEKQHSKKLNSKEPDSLPILQTEISHVPTYSMWYIDQTKAKLFCV